MTRKSKQSFSNEDNQKRCWYADLTLIAKRLKDAMFAAMTLSSFPRKNHTPWPSQMVKDLDVPVDRSQVNWETPEARRPIT